MAPLAKQLIRYLRNRRLIVFEVASIAVSGGVTTLVPQITDGSVPAWPESPFLSSAISTLQLDNVLHSVWFLVLLRM